MPNNFLQDHGIPKLIELTSKTNCPWIMSNLLDNVTHKPVANALEYHILIHKGVKVTQINVNNLIDWVHGDC